MAERRGHPRPGTIGAGVSTLLVSAVLLGGCRASAPLVESDHPQVLAHQLLEGPSPSTPGPFAVGFLTYGSGTDRRRPEYREGVAFTTGTVDASKLAQRTDRAAYWKRWWGFGPDSFPLNARVWYPQGDGPFPLVLVVHGNHDPRDFSDPGYAYLGELLASRGFILVSVDMNFLNGSIRGENDARGWMLLKHLEAWRGFEGDPDNPLHGLVDWERIALMGHSRGGEAVGHAAAFNRLAHYPDDAALTFDFGFRIRSLVAIAPVDGQYEPADRPVPLEDVNYLVFHGSHDGDVTSFAGLRQYQRVRFSGAVPAFKSAVFVYRGNHGQWNSGWGALDRGPRSARILDLRGLLPAEDQLEFARVYVTAFLEATLLAEDRWLPLFRDHRVAGGWLAPTMYKTRFQHASFRPLADFAEDIDLTTGSVPGVRLQGEGLSTWKEGEMVLRSRITPQRQRSQEAFGAWLGWHRADGGETPGYRISLPAGLATAWGVDGESTLDLVVVPTTRRPSPPGGDDEGGGEAEETPDEGRGPGGGHMHFSLEVRDASGERARLPAGAFGPLRPPLEVRVFRRRDLERSRLPTLHEMVGHGLSIPLEEFTRANPRLDPGTLREVRIVFDGTPVGEIILSEVGFSRPEPAFLRPRIPVEGWSPSP